MVILESTSPVGTTEQLRDLIAKLRPDLKCPGLTRETPGHFDRLLPRAGAAGQNPRGTDQQRPLDRRDHAALCAQGAGVLQAVRARRLRGDRLRARPR